MLHLTPEEEAVFQDLAYFYHREAIEAKLKTYFQELQTSLKAVLSAYQEHLPPQVLATNCKYSRGENYQGAPYRVLDCPNLLDKDNQFAFRCVLLWGRGWGAHLLLGGPVADAIRRGIVHHLQYELHANCYLSRADTPWAMTAEEDQAVRSFDIEVDEVDAINRSRSFLKLSRYWALEEAEAFAQETPRWLDRLLASSTFWLG